MNISPPPPMELPYDGQGYVHGDTERRASRYLLSVQQFHVGTNPRYAPREGLTFCNIFVWDWTRAVLAEIPHWFDIHGNRMEPHARGALEMRARHMVLWLRTEPGARHGWRSVDQEHARAGVLEGLPTLATWENPDASRSSHVVVVLPPSSSDAPLQVAQAGRVCGEWIPLASAFGRDRLDAVQFWQHA